MRKVAQPVKVKVGDVLDLRLAGDATNKKVEFGINGIGLHYMQLNLVPENRSEPAGLLTQGPRQAFQDTIPATR